MHQPGSNLWLYIISFFTLFWLCPAPVVAQVVPPGLGKTNLSSWVAIGVQQNLSGAEGRGWSSSTYTGMGRVSSPEGHNPFKYPGIFIINQEFYNRFHRDWEYSLALSYRKQALYSDDASFLRAIPPSKNEVRLYSRFSYLWKTNFMDITPTIRQEISKYYTPEWAGFSENWRLRTRFRLKFTIPLSNDGNHRFMVYSEQLFSTSRKLTAEKWTKFKYADSRFSFYYSLSPNNVPITFNVGYMLNCVNADTDYAGNYFAFDVIWKNPFSAPQK